MPQNPQNHPQNHIILPDGSNYVLINLQDNFKNNSTDFKKTDSKTDSKNPKNSEEIIKSVIKEYNFEPQQEYRFLFSNLFQADVFKKYLTKLYPNSSFLPWQSTFFSFKVSDIPSYHNLNPEINWKNYLNNFNRYSYFEVKNLDQPEALVVKDFMLGSFAFTKINKKIPGKIPENIADSIPQDIAQNNSANDAKNNTKNNTENTIQIIPEKVDKIKNSFFKAWTNLQKTFLIKSVDSEYVGSLTLVLIPQQKEVQLHSVAGISILQIKNFHNNNSVHKDVHDKNAKKVQNKLAILLSAAFDFVQNSQEIDSDWNFTFSCSKLPVLAKYEKFGFTKNDSCLGIKFTL